MLSHAIVPLAALLWFAPASSETPIDPESAPRTEAPQTGATDLPQSHEEVLRLAEELWRAGQDARVAELFDRAYARDPRPEYLFGQGQALLALQRCDEAVPLFRRFLEADITPAQRAAARDQISACEEIQGADVPAADPAAPIDGDAREPAPPPPVHGPPVEPGPPRPLPLRRDRWALALLGTGSIVTTAGVVALGVSAAQVGRSEGTQTEDDYADRIRWSRAGIVTGASLAAVGTALVVAGIIEYVVRRRRSARMEGTTRFSRMASGSGRRPASWPTHRGRAAGSPGPALAGDCEWSC